MPDTEPTISGSTAPNTWTLGFVEDAPDGVKWVGERSLSDDEYERYMDAVGFVLGRKEQASLKLIIGNYGEFRALQSWMVIAFTTTKQDAWPDRGESQFQLRRVLLNWLNSIRLFDDHNRARFVRSYGDPSPELDAYKLARSEIYDEISSYRFMFELRNYAQHCGEVPVQAQIRQDAAGNSLDLHFDRDELLRQFGNWKRVKPDLESGPEHIGLDTPIEETMVAVTRLAQKVAELDMPRFTQSIQAIQEVVGPPLEDPNHRPTIFRMRPTVDDSGEEVMKIDIAPVFLVQQATTDADTGAVEMPDFRAHRPRLTTEKSTRRCQGPLNKVTHLPAETCTERATMSFYFPHQEGIAFLFACDQHALALGQWAGKRFGGCFGGAAEKTQVAMEMAAKTFARIDEPHGADYDKLVPVPGAPATQSLFSPPSTTGDTESHDPE